MVILKEQIKMLGLFQLLPNVVLSNCLLPADL